MRYAYLHKVLAQEGAKIRQRFGGTFQMEPQRTSAYLVPALEHLALQCYDESLTPYDQRLTFKGAPMVPVEVNGVPVYILREVECPKTTC